MKAPILYILSGILLPFLLTPLAWQMEEELTVWIGALIVLATSYLVMQNSLVGPMKVAIWLSLGLLTTDQSIRILEGYENSLLSLPRIIFQISAVWLAYVFIEKKPGVRLAMSYVFVLLLYAYNSLGYDYLANYIRYRTITMELNEPAPGVKVGLTATGEVIGPEQLKGKVVLLDFWNTRCAPCVKAFPELQQLHETYQANERTAIYSVNIPFPEERNSSAAFEFIAKKGFSFPVLRGDGQTKAAYGITGVPMVIILKEGQMLFRGNLQTAISYFESLLHLR